MNITPQDMQILFCHLADTYYDLGDAPKTMILLTKARSLFEKNHYAGYSPESLAIPIEIIERLANAHHALNGFAKQNEILLFELKMLK